jgi:TetR/AcrR family transcriptional repressor of nem operon
MPWPATQRATTRQMILDSASRLFALQCFESAGLTRGAFYSHFASKTELYTEAIRNAANAGGAIQEEAGKDGLQQMQAACTVR